VSTRASGEGSIVHRADGRWCGALQVAGRRSYVYGKTRSEVADKLRALTSQARATGHLPSAGKLTVGEYLSDWLTQAEARLRPKTLERYDGVVRVHITPAIGHVSLPKLSSLQLARFYAALSKQTGARTVQITHRLLRKALGDAQRWQLIAVNPAAAVDSPTVEPKEPTLWTQEQAGAFVRAMLDGDGGTYGYLYAFLVASGCRLGEAFGLHWSDLNGDTVAIERQVTFYKNHPIELPPKTKAGRRGITLPEWGVEALRRQRAHLAALKLRQGADWKGLDNSIFTSETGAVPTPSNVRRGLAAACRRLRLPVCRVHDFRHLHLSLHALSGAPLKTAQQRAGHSSASVTANIYQHVLSDEADRRAAISLNYVVARR
jgi:integrase